MAEKTGTPLEKVSQVRASVVDSLGPVWITTVEELVTTAYEPRGREGLAGLLNMAPTGGVLVLYSRLADGKPAPEHMEWAGKPAE